MFSIKYVLVFAWWEWRWRGHKLYRQPEVILQLLSKLPFSSLELEPGDEMTESVFENIHRALSVMIKFMKIFDNNSVCTFCQQQCTAWTLMDVKIKYKYACLMVLLIMCLHVCWSVFLAEHLIMYCCMCHSWEIALCSSNADDSNCTRQLHLFTQDNQVSVLSKRES